jgi:lysophospholipase L1-like esterase
MRARTALLLLAGLLLVVACEGSEPQTDGSVADDRARDEVAATDLPPHPLRYTAVGDSLGTGTGAATSYVVEYASWLEDATGATVETTNLAVDGWTSADLLDALRDDDELRRAVADAHVVTWNIGGNDLLAALGSHLQGTCGGADEERCLRDAVDTAARNGEAVVGELLGLRGGDADGARTFDLYLPVSDDPRVAPYVARLRPHLDELNDRLTTSAERRGIPVADVGGAFDAHASTSAARGASLISGDGLHPSDRGHEVIAAQLAALGVEVRTTEPR